MTAFKKSMADQESVAQKNLEAAQKGLDAAKTPAQRQKYEGEIQAAQEGITRSREYYDQVKQMSQGELLFNTQCARCHCTERHSASGTSRQPGSRVQSGSTRGARR